MTTKTKQAYIYYCEDCRAINDWARAKRRVRTLCGACNYIRTCYIVERVETKDVGVEAPQAVRTGEAAVLLGVSPQTVRNWCDGGRLEYVMLPSGQRRISVREIERVLRGGKLRRNREIEGEGEG
jgi:excisionase family DNA binding protein